LPVLARRVVMAPPNRMKLSNYRLETEVVLRECDASRRSPRLVELGKGPAICGGAESREKLG
jgi:hypothetical protein